MENDGGFQLSGAMYNKVKWLVTIVMPALMTLYFTIDQTLGLPHTDEVMGISSAVMTFLGVVLGISTKNYNNDDSRYFGEIHVAGTDEGAQISHQVFNEDPTGHTIADKQEVTFKVVHS